MTYLLYHGSSLALKIPTNDGGSPSPASGGSPDVQNFLVWDNIPVAGDIVIGLDEVAYPYAYNYAISKTKTDGTPLWTTTAGPATAAAPALHTPIISSATL